jgi:hypothetical protein
VRPHHHSRTRGQAAIEYLVTYGWAIVIILVVISALLYFGVISPKKLIPDSCDFGFQIECIEAEIGHDGYIILHLQNNMGDAIIIEKTETTELLFTPPDPLLHPELDRNITISNGGKQFFAMHAIETFPEGDKVNVNMRLFFRRAEDLGNGDPTETYPTYNITGKVVSRVCAGTFIPRDAATGTAPHYDTC